MLNVMRVFCPQDEAAGSDQSADQQGGFTRRGAHPAGTLRSHQADVDVRSWTQVRLYFPFSLERHIQMKACVLSLIFVSVFAQHRHRVQFVSEWLRAPLRNRSDSVILWNRFWGSDLCPSAAAATCCHGNLRKDHKLHRNKQSGEYQWPHEPGEIILSKLGNCG